MKLKSVLFDLDGVLIDTEGIYTEFWADIDRLYPTGVENFALVIKGSTLPSILNKYFAPEHHADIVRRLRDNEDNMVYRLFDGVEDLMASLAAEGVTMAIVTSSNRPKMDVVYAQVPAFGKYISALVTDEDVTASKPDPQGYLIAAERLGAAPGECVVVEDSIAGLRAGRAAGAAVAGIATTNPRSAIEPLADIVVDATGELSVNILCNILR